MVMNKIWRGYAVKGHALRIEITMLTMLLLAGGVGAATEINSCTTISSPGEYVLNQSIINSSVTSCINITSSDVIFDGAGYRIDGIGRLGNTYGVYVNNPEITLTNVTVKNLKVTDWNYGIYYINAQNGRIENSIADSNWDGIYLNNSNNNTLIRNNASSNRDGILFYLSSNNTLISNNASSNVYGISLTSNSNNNTLISNIAVSNSDGIYIFSGRNSRNVLTSNTAVSNTNSGIYLDYTSSNDLTNNNASSNGMGIVLYSASDRNILTNNTAISNGAGIYLWDSLSSVLINNTAISNGDGIYLWYSFNNVLSGNIANSSSETGIYLELSDDNGLSDNIISNNSAGITIKRSYSYNYAVGSQTMSKNSTNLNEHSKKFITDHSDILLNNTDLYRDRSAGLLNIDSNKSTASAVKGNNNRISNNTINSNKIIGIDIAASSSNLIYNNYFNNTRNARDDGNNIWNITKTAGRNIIGGPFLGGNYWSDYAGVDTDGDGLGDTLLPYNSSGNITNGGDFLPLTATLAPTYGISGMKFNDLNSNGIKDPGEPGIANWTIRLTGFDTLDRAVVKRIITTDLNGNYGFINLTPGFYTVFEKLQRDWVPTTSPARSVHLGTNQRVIVNFGNKKIRQ